MKNPTGNKLEKLVFGMFDQMVEGSDKYITEQGSTWLIFTEDKRWVVEFTKDKTLWFNYNLFQSELDLVSKDCTQERDLIKNWFESRFLNTNKVKRTSEFWRLQELNVEDTIQNGVRHTTFLPNCPNGWVEDTIQNGVRHTLAGFPHHSLELEDTIQNGVRQTNKRLQKPFRSIKDAIQNGVKHTEPGIFNHPMFVEETIQNGVKDTKKSHWIKSIEAEDIIENGICDVKHSYDFEEIVVKDIIEDSYPHKHRVEGVIRNTVKDGI